MTELEPWPGYDGQSWQERYEAIHARHRALLEQTGSALTGQIERATKAESVNADLLEALRPFAGFLSKALKGHTPGWTESMGDDHVVFSWNNAILKLGDLRGACAAISLAEKSNG